MALRLAALLNRVFMKSGLGSGLGASACVDTCEALVGRIGGAPIARKNGHHFGIDRQGLFGSCHGHVEQADLGVDAGFPR